MKSRENELTHQCVGICVEQRCSIERGVRAAVAIVCLH